MRRIAKCFCGNKILLDRPQSFRKINKRRVCIACAMKNDTGKLQLRGSRSYYPTPYHAARFNTLCALQWERKQRTEARKIRETAV